MAFAAFVWFMFIPENWETLFWPVSLPLAWVADFIPSIVKISAVSPMPGAVRGVLASMAILAPIAGIIALLNDCVGLRIQEFANQSSAFRILVGIPFAALVVLGAFCYLFWFPFAEVKLGYTLSRGHRFLNAMMTNRLGLSAGALLIGFFVAGAIHGFSIRFCNILNFFFQFTDIEDHRK
jgi:hypothetical protein